MAAFSDGHLCALNIGTLHAAQVALPEDLPHPPLLASLPTPEGPEVLLYSQHDEVLSFDGTRSTRLVRSPAAIRALVPLREPWSFAVGDEAGNLCIGTVTATSTPRTARRSGLRSGGAAITALTVTQAGLHAALAAADADGTIRLWKLPDLRRIGRPLSAHGKPVTALTSLVMRNGNRLLTAGADCTLRILEPSENAFSAAPVAQERITASALSPTVPHLLATARSGHVTVRDVAAGRPATIILEDVKVTAAAWPGIRGAQHLAVALDDNRILVIDPESPHAEPRHELTGHHLPVKTLVPLSNGHADLLASAGPDGRICLWNLRSGEQVADFPDHMFSVRCLATTRTDSGPLLASGGSDGNIRIWDMRTFEQRGPTIRCDQFFVNDLAFVPGPPGPLTVASVGQDGSLVLWDVNSGRQVGRFDAEDGELTAVTALPSTTRRQVLVTAGRSSIHLWETARGDGKLLQIVTGRSVSALRTVADHSRDRSALLLATDDDGTSVFRLHLDRI
ncbi:WD40 repeat domain-containing protein [Streptomyces sp. NPDC058486]|uniref:WD40 repeat domain-containing protein n=1 Tax=unclassified Streptomyces TaxID=2593676 RepID=UPI00364E37FB